MKVKGIGVSGGKAVGKILRITLDQQIDMEEQSSCLPEEEILLYKEHMAKVMEALGDNAERCKSEGAEVQAEMYEMHQQLLDDPEYEEAVIADINQGYSSGAAVARATKMHSDILSSMDNEFMAARAKDIEDVGNRLLCSIQGRAYLTLEDLKDECIAVAENLPPSVISGADKNKLRGIILAKGSKTSHVAILATNMQIPTVMGCKDIEGLIEGEMAYINADQGYYLSDLTPEEEKQAQLEVERYKKKQQKLTENKNLATEMKDGYKLELLGNIMDQNGADLVLENHGDGVGLFRTEFLYMNRKNLPTEQEQASIYSAIVKRMQGRPVTIRTLDIGADKEAESLKLPKEENPFLGYRAIRICLKNQELFKTQLRAIYQASVYGKVKIMFPMISGGDELDEALQIVEEVKEELREEKKAFDEAVPIGIMIEVPSAALMAEALIQKVDFFSIGTNDLTQYVLAVDRGNEQIAEMYDYFHPAVLHLIARVIEACNRYGKYCSVCGEMGADPYAIPLLIGMGLKHISMNPPSILLSRALIREMSVQEAENLYRKAARETSTKKVHEAVETGLPESYLQWIKE